MGYVEEEPASFRQEIFDSAQGLNPVCRSSEMPEDIPQTSNDVERLAGVPASQVFGAITPNFHPIWSLREYSLTRLIQHNPPKSGGGCDTQRPAAISGADVKE
jgi:hypothetical protein